MNPKSFEVEVEGRVSLDICSVELSTLAVTVAPGGELWFILKSLDWVTT